MQSVAKLIAVFLIWLSFTVVMTSGGSPLSEATGDAAVIMTVVLAIAAGGSTVAVWQSNEPRQLREPRIEKAKRTHSRVGRFVDSLGDDEIAELRARLMVDDGEVVALEDLVSQQRQGQYGERDS
jgi:hypothetical protein